SLMLERRRHARLLPPFPTRRSSDLIAPGGGRHQVLPHREGREDLAALRHEADAALRDAVGRQLLDAFASQGDGAAACAMHSAQADRKSTRLNSSHVKISYAVFCLKE